MADESDPILENDLLRVTVSPSLGGSMRQLLYKPANLDFFYANPRASSLSGRVEHYPGGWFERLPESESFASTPRSGMEWAVPFAHTRGELGAESAIVLNGASPRAPVGVRKVFALVPDRAAVTLTETLTNTTADELEVFWGQHVMLTAPFFGAGCRIEAPATSYFDPNEEPILRMLWPLAPGGADLSHVGAGAPGSKLLYLSDFAAGRYRVVNARRGLAFEMAWDAALFPYCWLMENTTSTAAPWWGTQDSLSLNPFTGLPAALKEGHGLLTIPAGQSVTTVFEAEVKPISD